MSSPHPQGPPLACVPTLPSRTPTHIFQSDDVGVLPVPQKNFNLFRGVSLALVNDLRKGVHVAVLEDQLQSPDLPQSPMLQGVESQPAHLSPIHRAPSTTPPRPEDQGYITRHLHPSRAAWPGRGHEAHLDSIFCVGSFVDAALALRVRAHTNRLLHHVAIAKNQVLPV